MIPGKSGSRDRNFAIRFFRSSSLTGTTWYPDCFNSPSVNGCFTCRFACSGCVLRFLDKRSTASVTVSILLIRFSSLGDVILTLPLLRALREKFPEARIDVATKQEYGKIIELSGLATEVFCL